jgi:diaminohydroxyphosphoribosylaminopyrimidine deaminase/5-amino-6-(5-phosphoribosylamino)uracil reductase
MTAVHSSPDELFMQRAFALAMNGRGTVSPNPMVGCVIVHDGSIIGEGYHRQYGGPHAEVAAIRAVTKPDLLAESTAYVTLEPCAHFGKTPPCADLLIEKKLKRVVVANLDTNPLVAGNGIRKLREAGIEVTTGVLDATGRNVNRRFFTLIEKRRPYIILKWAQTADHYVARENYDSKWISNAYARQMVHQWRTEEDAVVVGTRTAQHDNPQLNVRSWHGRNPVRVVLDRYLRLSDNLHLFDGTSPTLCYNVLKHHETSNLKFIRLAEEGFISHVINDLASRKIQSIIVEGGSLTLTHFIEHSLWDEARVFTSRQTFRKGIPAPMLNGCLLDEIHIMDDRLAWYASPAARAEFFPPGLH